MHLSTLLNIYMHISFNATQFPWDGWKKKSASRALFFRAYGFLLLRLYRLIFQFSQLNININWFICNNCIYCAHFAVWHCICAAFQRSYAISFGIMLIWNFLLFFFFVSLIIFICFRNANFLRSIKSRLATAIEQFRKCSIELARQFVMIDRNILIDYRCAVFLYSFFS